LAKKRFNIPDLSIENWSLKICDWQLLWCHAVGLYMTHDQFSMTNSQSFQSGKSVHAKKRPKK